MANELEPMAALLRDNEVLTKELATPPWNEGDNASPLDSYLVKIRREGPAKNGPMKQRLDTLAENNATLLALIAVYSPHAKTAAFATEATKFRTYAISWRDRWNSVLETFMAGGNLAAASAPFPREFPNVVQMELEAAR